MTQSSKKLNIDTASLPELVDEVTRLRAELIEVSESSLRDFLYFKELNANLRETLKKFLKDDILGVISSIQDIIRIDKPDPDFIATYLGIVEEKVNQQLKDLESNND